MCIVLGCAMGNILDSIPCSRLDNIPDSMLGSILGNHLDSMLGRIMCSNLSNILGHIPGRTLRNLLGTVRGGRLDQTQGSHRDPSLDTLSCNSDMYFHPIYAQHRSPCTPHHTTRTAGVTHTHATAHRSPPTTEPTARTPSMQRMPHPSVLPRHTPRHTHTHTLQTHPIPPYHKHHTATRQFRAHVQHTTTTTKQLLTLPLCLPRTYSTIKPISHRSFGASRARSWAILRAQLLKYSPSRVRSSAILHGHALFSTSS